MKAIWNILVGLVLTAVPVTAQELGVEWGTAERESRYYRIVDFPVPDGVHLEAGSFADLPDGRIAVGTRRGDIWILSGVDERHPQPKFQRFASGLDEVLGLDFRDGAFYATQQAELSRITDENGDGRADKFETLSDGWGFNNYHEFAVGSKLDADGNTWVALCLSKSYYSTELFRGWALKITPDGRTIPIASGIRSPLGVGLNAAGVMIYAESQGPWNGSCSLKHLKPGGFMGHPVSFNWYPNAPNMGPVPVVPNGPSRLEIERKRVKELVPYAVVFPYRKMGQSISGFVLDKTKGKFGPFSDQIFIGDYSLSVVMRATMEEINGVWQGACYPFREGLATGILNVHFTKNGKLLAGGTNRGWPVRGARNNVLQRLDWTGLTPFELKEINAHSDGFNLTFTKPVDPKTASDLASYQLETFTHIYRQGYGSPEVDQTTPKIRRAIVSRDRLSVRLVVEGMVQGHVHEFTLMGIRDATGEPPIHKQAYYTLNEIPIRP
ncbi:MAG: hypothetical protein ACJASX_001571 [Limisphaerales bacterium]|jgi:hypothetical protein